MPRDSSMILIIPPSIIDRYRNVALGIDVVHINKRPYFIAISKRLVVHYTYEESMTPGS